MDRRKFLKLACAGVPALGALRAAEARAGGGNAPRYAMVIDLRRCVGCHSCSVSCSVENRVPVGKYRASVGEYVIEGANPTVAPLPRLCNHCEEPACVPVCPVHATYKNADGLVLVDSDKCLACGFCVQACPYDARYINPETRSTDKCTFCVHRLQAGLLPVCVENCVGGARVFGDMNDPESLVSRTLKEHKGAIKVLAPEMGTKPNVYYVNLNAFLESPANVGLPMAEGAMPVGGGYA
ncbi:4Fe-4S dicluster domain-containing protein [Desulfovibrio sp. Fe33]|uniref:4Fe-4S dicluster domain-containing protein n=1 Tax=Desulfovibrio sp. Fe33 TaxID=3020842 RepID=UPI00234C0928|nr:4Fe-4S dicluster domain-containing protein [Desulfovibrio sp. Fe33]